VLDLNITACGSAWEYNKCMRNSRIIKNHLKCDNWKHSEDLFDSNTKITLFFLILTIFSMSETGLNIPLKFKVPASPACTEPWPDLEYFLPMQEIFSLLFIKWKRAIDTMKFLFCWIEEPGHKLNGWSWDILHTFLLGVLIKIFAVWLPVLPDKY
jgi:hypothetical protein